MTILSSLHLSDAIASEESVRITPSLRSQKGSIWSKLGTQFEFWEVEIHFRVTGRGRVGADGLAFWFTQAQGVEGPVSLLPCITGINFKTFFVFLNVALRTTS